MSEAITRPQELLQEQKAASGPGAPVSMFPNPEGLTVDPAAPLPRALRFLSQQVRHRHVFPCSPPAFTPALEQIRRGSDAAPTGGSRGCSHPLCHLLTTPSQAGFSHRDAQVLAPRRWMGRPFPGTHSVLSAFLGEFESTGFLSQIFHNHLQLKAL